MKKRLLIFAILPLMFFACKSKESTEEIIKKSLNSLGGFDAFNNLKSLKESGTIRIVSDGTEQKGTYIRYKSPDKYVQILVFEGSDTLYSGINGKISWDYNKSAGYSETKLEQQRNLIVPAAFYYKDDYINFTTTEMQQVNGKTAYEVALKDKQNNDRLWYIDAENFLLLKSYRTTDEGGIKTIHEDIFENFNILNNMNFPNKITQTISNGQRLTTFYWEITKIEPNLDIPEKIYLPPVTK